MAEIAAVADAFAGVIAECRYTCYACAILRDHVHLVIRKHRDSAEEMIFNFQEASRLRLRTRGKWLLLDSTIRRAVTEAGRIAGFNPDDASALAAIQKTSAQVLLIHGADVAKIPPSHSRRLHDAAPLHSRLVILDGENHDSILAGDNGGRVLGESVEWFDQWLNPPAMTEAKRITEP